jgi:hypothetical protein
MPLYVRVNKTGATLYCQPASCLFVSWVQQKTGHDHMRSKRLLGASSRQRYHLNHKDLLHHMNLAGLFLLLLAKLINCLCLVRLVLISPSPLSLLDVCLSLLASCQLSPACVLFHNMEPRFSDADTQKLRVESYGDMIIYLFTRWSRVDLILQFFL